MELARLYQSGVADIEIGGDWYDAVRVDDHRLLLTVGDVSGQGLAAATALASPEVAPKLAAQGVEQRPLGPAAMAESGRAEVTKWAALVRQSGAQVD